jgi:phage terminase large subunit
VYKERYLSGVTATEHAKAIQAVGGDYLWTVADHDAGDRADFEAQGIRTEKADKRVSTGIQKVQARLETAGDGKPRMFIHTSCANLIKEFYGYQWQPDKEGKNAKEEPCKESDHAMDALRYLVMELDARAELTVY